MDAVSSVTPFSLSVLRTFRSQARSLLSGMFWVIFVLRFLVVNGFAAAAANPATWRTRGSKLPAPSREPKTQFSCAAFWRKRIVVLGGSGLQRARAEPLGSGRISAPNARQRSKPEGRRQTGAFRGGPGSVHRMRARPGLSGRRPKCLPHNPIPNCHDSVRQTCYDRLRTTRTERKAPWPTLRPETKSLICG